MSDDPLPAEDPSRDQYWEKQKSKVYAKTLPPAKLDKQLATLDRLRLRMDRARLARLRGEAFDPDTLFAWYVPVETDAEYKQWWDQAYKDLLEAKLTPERRAIVEARMKRVKRAMDEEWIVRARWGMML